MGIFSIIHFATGEFSVLLILRNLLWITLGNIIDRGILLGLSSIITNVEE